jgi:hypothetical protein
MPQRRKVPPEIEAQVRLRAGFLCEYCHSAERWQYVEFTVDHVVPLSCGGGDHLDNLALACFHCNRRKWDRQSAADPLTGESSMLFHPRRHLWSDHFVWAADGVHLVGLTAIGRATVAHLDLNRERALFIRGADVKIDRHPPPGDPRQKS